ncbi:MAG: DHH family phosphoesterase [Candidatus Bathyarchaeota archaeon]|nr:MAG: DHH family phosphoesterase [Candidatus Bathyarchaeota archaeon]
MRVTKSQINKFLKNVSEAAKLISDCVEAEGFIHVTSHLDADGITAAGIIGRALTRLGGTFRLRVERWMDDNVVDEIAGDKPTLAIFTDLGGGYLDLLSGKLSDQRVIILDHHQPIGEASSDIMHINPHLHGIDGSRDLSGAGIAYFVAKALDEKNVDLACIAVAGALGDIQDKYEQRSLGGANREIVEDAVDSGYLRIEKDLLFFGRETRPIHKALAYTTSPYIPGLSGEEDKSLAFLASVEITPKHEDKWRALRDLSSDEKMRLSSALSDYLISRGFPSDVALSLVGTVYTLTREEPWTPLRDAREFTVLLNATGRMNRAGLGVTICMGDRGKALDEAGEMLNAYRRSIAKCLSWVNEKPNRIEELDSIYVVRGEGFIDEKMISAVSTILSSSLPKPMKPLLAYSKVSGEDMAKVSARTVALLTEKGLDLGEILRVAGEECHGRGGGHDIAAGAQVPMKNIASFIELADKLVKKQLEGVELGG